MKNKYGTTRLIKDIEALISAELSLEKSQLSHEKMIIKQKQRVTTRVNYCIIAFNNIIFEAFIDRKTMEPFTEIKGKNKDKEISISIFNALYFLCFFFQGAIYPKVNCNLIASRHSHLPSIYISNLNSKLQLVDHFVWPFNS